MQFDSVNCRHMTEHISRTQIEKFYARILDASAMIATWEHLDSCDPCHQLFQKAFRNKRQDAPIRVALSPEHLFKDDHFDYETLAVYIDQTIDDEMREIADIHLKACRDCRGNLDSLLAFRREIEPELKVRYGPEEQSSVTGWLSYLWNWPTAWKPAHTFATLIIIGLAVATLVFLIKSGAGKKPVAGDLIGITPSPSAAAKVSPSPYDPSKNLNPSSEMGAAPKPDSMTSQARSTHLRHLSGKKSKNRFHASSSTETIVKLSDEGRSIAIDSSGNLTGISNLSPEHQESIREFLVATEVRRPEILEEINGVKSALRGMGEKPSFGLLSPVGVVTIVDRPIFQWEPLDGATAYRVQVSDSPSREPISSELLPADATQWTPTEELQRGKVYSWLVIAIVNGKEIVSPLVSMPEAKFKVLGPEKMRELSLVKRANSQLALGVFYAREGMLAEAERAFQNLADNNPQSPTAERLLSTIKSWQSPR
ncbi:MAG: tetratricopeptide repeat protein [Blastocatellales bacterium]